MAENPVAAASAARRHERLVRAARSAQSPATGAYGLLTDFTANPPASFVAQAFGSPRSAFRAKFQFRPERLVLPENQAVNIAAGVSSGTTSAWLQVRRLGADFQVRGLARLDDGSAAVTPWLSIPGGYQSLDFAWWSATQAGANDGGIRLVTGAWTMTQALGMDNDGQRTERFRLGSPFAAAEVVDGLAYFDDVNVWF
jgi:hypothetical protein